MGFAGKASREGILSLESAVKEARDPFVQTGVQLAIDGLEPTSIRNILETEIEYIENRHKLGMVQWILQQVLLGNRTKQDAGPCVFTGFPDGNSRLVLNSEPKLRHTCQ